ncbi:MAG: thioredoxin family protein [Campylobacterota bacterium]|nr:thioredoxin family protein [Campylobacterota bacterium]
MKTLLIIALLAASLFGKNYKDFAKDHNYETNYEVALKKAKEQKKDVMFIMVANFCPWCQKFEKRVLSKKKIDAQIHKKYIPLIINREEKNFPKEFESPFIPVMYFVDYKTNTIKKKVVGYNNKADFISIVNE